MEEVLLHIAGIGTQASSGILCELRWGAATTLSHRDQDAMNPHINRHGVESFIGEK